MPSISTPIKIRHAQLQRFITLNQTSAVLVPCYLLGLAAIFKVRLVHLNERKKRRGKKQGKEEMRLKLETVEQ